MTNVKDILVLVSSPSAKDRDLITKACNFAEKAHEGEKRMTGEPYFVHVFETGKNLATFGMDAKTIAAGLLHDTIEDGHISPEIIEKEFGKEILFFVNGVTKLGKLKYRGLQRHVESLRKFFVATAKDVRVLIIKLADRLHNIQTLHGHTKPEKQRRIALETLEIFAPLANLIGMWKLKGELENEAFPYVYPEDYKKVKDLLKQRQKVDQKYLKKVHRTLQKELAKHGVRDNVIETVHRVKSLFSLHKKLQKHNMDINQIFDIMALRVCVQTIEDCYRVLGIIHGIWTPLSGRVKDYIAVPKPNGYRSLHTTIFTGNGGIVEVQIRTADMHKEAEYGIASHLAYKEGIFEKIRNIVKKKMDKNNPKLTKNLKWLKHIIEWQDNTLKNGDYLDSLKMNFFESRIFIFTPKGDVIDLPEDSTIVDFAYAVHSDIGNHISGAELNGKFVSLGTKLKNRDIVCIQTKKDSHPANKWIAYAKTTLAKRQIRITLQNIKDAKRN